MESGLPEEPASGWVKISTVVVYSTVWRKKKGVVEIEDNGTGMGEQTQAKIFQLYFSTKQNGMGIGLTLCKKIVEAHGRRIEVYSRPGVGTRFAVFCRTDGMEGLKKA